MKWGIIGPGNIATEFAEDLKHVILESCTVGAVLGDDPHLTEKFKNTFNGTIATTSFDDFITNKPDAVYIATPHPLHHQYTIKCLEHNIPVLCEKPLAINEKQVTEMVNASASHHTFLMEGMWTRFLPSFQFILQTIKAGTIGNVLHVHADMSFIAEKNITNRFFNPALGGGSLLDLGIYPVYLTYFLLGNPDVIFACGKINESNIDETCGIALKYNNGSFALLESSIITQTDGNACIYGSEGTIRIKKPWTEQPEQVEVIINNESSFKNIPAWQGRGFQFEVEEVIKCIKENRTESTIIPHRSSLEVIKILDAVKGQLGIVHPEM